MEQKNDCLTIFLDMITSVLNFIEVRKTNSFSLFNFGTVPRHENIQKIFIQVELCEGLQNS